MTASNDDVAERVRALFTDPRSPALERFDQGLATSVADVRRAERISTETAVEDLREAFSESAIPGGPLSLDDYLEMLRRDVIPNAVSVSLPSYTGHMTSALPAFLPPMSSFLTALNQNVVKVETSKAFTLLERQTMAMMHRLVFGDTDEFYAHHIQNRESTLGIVTSCGTLANITAMWMARNKALRSSDEFGGLQDEGLLAALRHYGYTGGAVVIGSELMHYSMDKLGSLLGLGARNVIKVELDPAGRVDVQALRRVIEECLEQKRLIVAVVGVAGTTETGNVDDLAALGEIAREYRIHYHVDAAWGGPILFSERHRSILAGIELADTVTVCGHKQLYLPQGISMVLCRDPHDFYHIQAAARYQARVESFDLGKHSAEGSRPANSAYLHAGLHLLGQRGYAYLIDEGIRKARYFAELILRHDVFELIEEPRTNIVVYRYVPDALRERARAKTLSPEDHYVINTFNEVLQDFMFLHGSSFVSRTTLKQGRNQRRQDTVVLRAVIANPLTTEEHLAKVLEDQIAVADELLRERRMSFAEILQLLVRQTSSVSRQ